MSANRARLLAGPRIGITPIPDPGGIVQDFATVNTQTWNFEADKLVGPYAMSDPWVIGPVEVVSTSPAYDATGSGTFDDGSTPYTNRPMNGMMLNPATGITGGGTTGVAQAFDGLDSNQATDGSTIMDWDVSLNVALPSEVAVGSLVKARSTPTPNLEGRANVTDLGILTVLPEGATPPAAGSFRPHPTDSTKTSYFTVDDIDMSVLLNLAVPVGATAPDAATVAAKFAKTYQTFFTNNLFTRSINPGNQMSAYGRDIANDIGEAMLFCCLDVPDADKLPVVKGLIQLGLDVWRRAVNGGQFPSLNASFGGGSHWFKAPLVFAAALLGNAANTTALASLRQYADASQRKMFAEDITHVLINRQRIETARAAPDSGYEAEPYLDYMENSPEWSSKPLDYSFGGSSWKTKYRSNVSGSSTGYLLALQLIAGAKALWNNPVIFGYSDRWQNWRKLEPRVLDAELPAFAEDMADEYWPTYSATAPSIVRRVARGSYVWFEFDKLLDLARVPATGDFVVLVNGVAATISAVSVYGYSLAVTLSAPIAQGQTVTLAYTPGATPARTLGNTNLTTITAGAATNMTGALPTPAAGIELAYNAANDTSRQVLATAQPPTQTGIQKFLIGMRLRLAARESNANLFGNATMSSGALRAYTPTTTEIRLLMGGTSLRLPSAISAADDNQTITLWIAIDFTKATLAEIYRAVIARDAGISTLSLGSTALPTTTTHSTDTFLAGGLALLGAKNLANAIKGSMEWFYFDWGDASLTLPTSLTGAEFANDFYPGDNGELITGSAGQLYYYDTLLGYNSDGGFPNRGKGAALALAPQRPTEEFPFTVPPAG